MTPLKRCSLVSSSEALLCKQRLISVHYPWHTEYVTKCQVRFLSWCWISDGILIGLKAKKCKARFNLFSFLFFAVGLNANMHNPVCCALNIRYINTYTDSHYARLVMQQVQPSVDAWISYKIIVALQIITSDNIILFLVF